jgi:SNF2 family DNA or RNA helicase
VANDEKIHLGHRGVMNLVPYQLDPALQALRQPRSRILIADAVGLGKTLEAGVLATELIQRGRGKRILVVTQKAMLTQFQKEWWSRFSIPLVRLDSVGLARVRNRIPANHNPFNYFDRSIISVDTLKTNLEYRNYLENAWWDIIVIDECHNVAARASETGLSRRARLAKLLATRSDTLILLSATPHDGSARSFASLMTLLDPTAISDPDDYTPDDWSSGASRRTSRTRSAPTSRSAGPLACASPRHRKRRRPTEHCSTSPSHRPASTRPAASRSCSASACRRRFSPARPRR